MSDGPDDAVGECPIAAIGKVLGDAAKPPIVNAGIEAYEYLAHIFITTVFLGSDENMCQIFLTNFRILKSA